MAVLLWCLGIGMAVVWLGIVVVGPPYVPTHRKQLRQLFDELGLSGHDRVVDLGSGDGSVLVEAAKRGAKVNGVELNPFLVWIAHWRLRQYPDAAVALGSMWRYTLPSDTTYVFVFFAHRFMPQLERYLQQQGRHIRLISYGFAIEGRTPLRVIGAFNIYEF